MKRRTLFLIAVALEYSIGLFQIPSINAQIFINEISICNISKQLDPNYDYSGWIELYNSSTANVSISTLFFSDEEGNPLKYKLSTSRTLPAKGFAIVWLNNELTNTDTGNSLDTDADDGGFLSISNKEGKIYDTMKYPKQYTNISYGRTIDGNPTASLGYFLKSSFQTSNNNFTTSELIVEMPTISLSSGFYNSPISISINCATDDAKIYYTTDCSEPTQLSTLYNGSIPLEQTTSLRAKAYKEGYLEGLTATSTFLINERKPDLPVAFLTTDTINLYNDTIGIYCIGTNGSSLASSTGNYNQDWTRQAHFEFIDNNKTKISQPIGIGISGNISRIFDQKSFKIKAQEKFGKKRIDYQILPSRSDIRYKSILLRNGGQQWISLQLLHDAVIQSLADVTPLVFQATTPTVAYLNGKYWGIYNLRERSNQDLIYSHYGYDSENLDLLEWNYNLKQGTGNKTNWNSFCSYITSNDLSKNDIYNNVCNMMDIDNYIYYMSTEFLIKNSDWPNTNQKMFRLREEGQKWRWILNDLDNGLKSSQNTNLLKALIESTDTKMCYKLIVYLLQNEKFKEQYISTQCLVAGSVYAPNRFAKRLQSMKKLIEKEYPYHFAKWPTQADDNFDKKITEKINIENDACKQAFANLQTNFSLGSIYSLNISSTHQKANISFNGLQIPILPYEGKWFAEKKLILTAPLYDEGQKFAYWTIKTPNSLKKEITSTLNFLITDSTDIVAVYEGADSTRRAGLYINEISPDNTTYVDTLYKYEDWIEIYNSSNNPINLAGYYISNNKTKKELFQFSDKEKESTTVPAREYAIIWCSKKPERGIMHTNFKLSKEGGCIYLSKSNNKNEIELIDSLHYNETDENITSGRYPDAGETIVTFNNASFKEKNIYSSYNITSYIEKYPLVTEINELKANASTPNIYINANHTELFVQCEEGSSLRIIDLNGTIIQQKSELLPQNTINISEFNCGTYIIILENSVERKVLKFIR